MDAVRDELRAIIESELTERFRQEWPDTIVDLAQTPWTYVGHGDEEILVALAPGAARQLLSVADFSQPFEFALAFVRGNLTSGIMMPNDGVTGYWGRLVYLPPRNENGQKFPASIDLRLPGTNGDDVVAATGPVECDGCASPYLKEVQKTKDKVNVSVRVKLSSPPEVGVEIDFGKTDSGRRVLVHARAALLSVGDRGLVAYRAAGQGITKKGGNTATLTRADAARAVVIDYAQQKWLGNSFVATQPEQARAFILRHLTEGDTYDFVSFTRLVLDDGKSFADGSQPALLGVGYLNLPAIRPEVASCDTCGRETFRDFVVSAVESRKSEGGYLPLPTRDKDPGRRAIGCDDCFVGIPSLPQPLTGSPITGLGVTSRCIFPDENCDSYDVPVGIGERAFAITIKTKSPRY